MKTPKLYRKRKGRDGHYVGNWLCKLGGREVNLGTKVIDGPDGATARAAQAAGGRRNFKGDTTTAAEQLEQLGTVSAAAAKGIVFEGNINDALPSSPAPTPPVQPDQVIPPAAPPRQLPAIQHDNAGEAAATQAAAEETAGAGDDQAAGAAAEEVNLDEISELAVDAQVWVAAEYVRYKVYRGFATPELPDQGKKQLAAQWKKIVEYSGAAVILPPWVTGALIPGAIILSSTFAMARAFADAAKEQKAEDASSPASSSSSSRRDDIPAAA